MKFTFREKRIEDIKKGDVYIGVSYSPYDNEGFRDVSYDHMKVLDVEEKSIIVENKDLNLDQIIYGRKVGGTYYFRIKEKDN